MSVIASSDIYGNDEMMFDKKTLDKLKDVDIEELDYEDSEGDEEPE